MIGSIFLGIGSNREISKQNKIEEKARELGMHYEGECKVLLRGDEKK